LCICLCAPALEDKVMEGGAVVIWRIVTWLRSGAINQWHVLWIDITTHVSYSISLYLRHFRSIINRTLSWTFEEGQRLVLYWNNHVFTLFISFDLLPTTNHLTFIIVIIKFIINFNSFFIITNKALTIYINALKAFIIISLEYIYYIKSKKL
jgi:hypothetical protein